MQLRKPSERTDKINKMSFKAEQRRYLMYDCEYYEQTLGGNFTADWWIMLRLHRSSGLAPSKPCELEFEIWED